jgi:hypothetical protein
MTTRTGSAPRPVSGEVIGESRSERWRGFERRFGTISHILDEAIPIPGTGQRIGLDPAIGLIPWVGDILSAAVSFWLIAEAARFRIPGIVLLRMTFNALVDLAIGIIPFFGDLFDIVSRANTRNLELVRRYALDEQASTLEHRLFFAGLALIFHGAVWLFLVAVGALLGAIGRALGL